MSINEKPAQEVKNDFDAKVEEGTSLEVPHLTWTEQFHALWSCKRAAAACLACSSGAVLIGYDMTLIGSIIANAEFVQKFGVHDPETELWSLPANRQLYWSIVQYVCAMVGAIASGYLNDILGRRPVFLLLVGCTMVGTLVELFSPDWKVWIVPKVLFGAAMGLMQGTVPAYISELAPSHVRGFLLAMFQFWIMFGSFVAACVLEGTSHVEDEARKSLLSLRGNEPLYNVEEDLAQIVEVLEHGRQGKAVASSYIECFQGPNFRRTWLACLPMVMQHFLGYPLCGNYVAYFLTLSGVQNPFVITVISLTMAMLAIILAFALIELVGRRPQFLFGTFSILPCLLCIGILGFLKASTSVMSGVGALCIIWSFLWYLSVGAVGWTIVGEISSPRLRPKTTSIAAMINSLINMGWSIAIPYLVNAENANLGPKTALIFFGPSIFFAILAYFVLPETKGKTFEQLDVLFEKRTPAPNLLYGLDNTIVADIQADISEAFGNVVDLGWLGSGFCLGCTVTSFPVGRAYGLFNTKWIYISSLVMFAAGSALCGAAPTMNSMIVGRVWAGAGGAGMYLGTLNLFTALCLPSEQPIFMGMIALVYGSGAILGPIVGGLFADSAATWRWAFYINPVIVGVLLPLCVYILPTLPRCNELSMSRKLRAFDWFGTVLAAAMYVFFSLGFTMGGARWAWSDAATIGCMHAAYALSS
ncbi:hypothetical protein G7Z17_g1245 [Cylindrodendrum hubeiense]|uniref:Major facilitator superfamily (MFS) profile domain-containing protein n=1 Tax=Cylindrodendrum hubeiense TaxID=595255 RepID=A0A9P5LM99_9HYPO|nr:hypothetical protein G7Z17_g1245 [Cylindrodendrum hubeiense]